MSQHTKTFPHKCDKCSFKTITKSRLIYHKKIEHDKNTFKRAETRHIHQKLHNAEYLKNRCTCLTCGKIFSTSFQMKCHMNLHSDKFICQTCKKHFVSRKSLDKHEANHVLKRDFFLFYMQQNFLQ